MPTYSRLQRQASTASVARATEQLLCQCPVCGHIHRDDSELDSDLDGSFRGSGGTSDGSSRGDEDAAQVGSKASSNEWQWTPSMEIRKALPIPLTPRGHVKKGSNLPMIVKRVVWRISYLGKRCMITREVPEGNMDTECIHFVPRGTRRSLLNVFEYWWGLDLDTLNLDSTLNIATMLCHLHKAFDTMTPEPVFFFVPEMEVLEEMLAFTDQNSDALEQGAPRKAFDEAFKRTEGDFWKYAFIPVNFSSKRSIFCKKVDVTHTTRGEREVVDTECYIQISAPFDAPELQEILSNVHPFYVVADAGMKLNALDYDKREAIFKRSPRAETLYTIYLIWTAAPLNVREILKGYPPSLPPAGHSSENASDRIEVFDDDDPETSYGRAIWGRLQEKISHSLAEESDGDEGFQHVPSSPSHRPPKARQGVVGETPSPTPEIVSSRGPASDLSDAGTVTRAGLKAGQKSIHRQQQSDLFSASSGPPSSSSSSAGSSSLNLRNPRHSISSQPAPSTSSRSTSTSDSGPFGKRRPTAQSDSLIPTGPRMNENATRLIWQLPKESNEELAKLSKSFAASRSQAPSRSRGEIQSSLNPRARAHDGTTAEQLAAEPPSHRRLLQRRSFSKSSRPSTEGGTGSITSAARDPSRPRASSSSRVALDGNIPKRTQGSSASSTTGSSGTALPSTDNSKLLPTQKLYPGTRPLRPLPVAPAPKAEERLDTTTTSSEDVESKRRDALARLNEDIDRRVREHWKTGTMRSPGPGSVTKSPQKSLMRPLAGSGGGVSDSRISLQKQASQISHLSVRSPPRPADDAAASTSKRPRHSSESVKSSESPTKKPKSLPAEEDESKEETPAGQSGAEEDETSELEYAGEQVLIRINSGGR